MSAADNPSPVREPAPQAPLAPRRSLFRWGFLLAALALAGQGGYQLWLWASAPAPPEVELSHADPDVAQAIAEAQGMVRQRPRSPASWGHLGMMLHAHQYLPQAEVCYARAEKLAPQSPQWPYLLAVCAQTTGTTEVIPCLERAVARSQRNSSSAPRLALAEALLEGGQLDAAETHLDAVVAAEPSNARALLGLGRVALARGDNRQCVQHLSRAVEVEKPRPSLYEVLASAYHRLGDAQQAEAMARRARSSTDGEAAWPDPYLAEVSARETGLRGSNRLANAYLGEGMHAQAVAVMERLTQRRPESPEAWTGLGRMLVLCKRPAEAIPALQTAIRLDAAKSGPSFFLGGAYFELGKYPEAVRAFRRAIELQPTLANAHYELARALDRLGDRRAAVQSLRECLRHNPSSALGRYALGRFLAEQGEDEEAITHLAAAARQSPENGEVTRMLEMVRARAKPRATRPRGGSD